MSLSLKDRQIYDLVYMHVPYKNIAQQIGLSVGDVRLRAKAMGINPTVEKISIEQAVANLARSH